MLIRLAQAQLSLFTNVNFQLVLLSDKWLAHREPFEIKVRCFMSVLTGIQLNTVMV